MASIFSWNCRGFGVNKDDIIHLIESHRPGVVCLQETFLKNSTPYIKNYHVICKNNITTSRACGGVAILLSHDIPYHDIKLNTPLQAVAARISVNRALTICSLYLPPNDSISIHQLEDLHSQLPPPVLILGDFNGHNPLWGSSDINSRGQLVETFVDHTDMCILNNGEPTYFHAPTRSFHNLDLAVCSPCLAPLLSMRVWNDLYNSDHFPVLLTFNRSSDLSPQSSLRIDRADWTKFTTQVAFTEEMVDKPNINEAVEAITDSILHAAEVSIPKSSKKYIKYPKPWWNSQCKDAKKRQKKAWNTFRRYPTVENLTSFKRERAQARSIRRESKRKSWEEYVSSINSSTSSKEVWNKIRAISGHYVKSPIPILNINNTELTETKDIADAFGKSFSDVSKHDNFNASFLKYKRIAEKSSIKFTPSSSEEYNQDFNLIDLTMALQCLKKTSVGPDGIHNLMFKHLTYDSLLSILKLFNRIWNERKFPDAWRKSIIIPILKVGKDPTQTTSYRPISLTSCFCKVM